MRQSDLQNAQQICQLIFDLTQDEGNSIRFTNSNPDFGGPEEAVGFSKQFGPTVSYYGDTVLSCLQQIQCKESQDEAQVLS
jgi:hypothetical protein